MRSNVLLCAALPVMILLLSFVAGASAQDAAMSVGKLDTQAIEQALGLKGQTKDGVFKLTRPRDELRVELDGFTITPPMGLTAWVAFRPHGGQAMIMGDLPVLEDELQPVLSALIEAGVEVSALHNHFFGERPHVMFLHVGGMGDPAKLAGGLRSALDVLGKQPSPASEPAGSLDVASQLDVAKLASILGHEGRLSKGIYKVTVGRPQVRLTEMGVPVDSEMGFNSWAAFQGTMDKAAVAGDFAMLAEEVNPIVRELRRSGIEVVALHNHMLREEPRIFFLHFWGLGPAEDLARGVRAALDQMRRPQPSPGGR
jgi:hypothetical protein